MGVNPVSSLRSSWEGQSSAVMYELFHVQFVLELSGAICRKRVARGDQACQLKSLPISSPSVYLILRLVSSFLLGIVGGQQKDQQSFYRLSINILLGALIAKCSRRISMLGKMQNTSAPCSAKSCTDPGLVRINLNVMLCGTQAVTPAKGPSKEN